MTSSPTDQPVRGPVGMPAHLWELAKSDVRLSVPNRVRNAVANGLNAPDGVRRIAARVAVTGAAMGVPAAMLGLGGFLDAADQPVALAGGESPLDGFDGAPAMPGSYDGGSGPGGGHGGFGGGSQGGSGGGGLGGDGPSEGFAHATTQSDGGDVQSGLGSTWHVQDPTGEAGDWLTVQMFQDVTVTETADGMFVVDAWQFIVIRDDDGNEYVFKEHYQVIVPDPPGQETDLIIHERGFVHVVERPDGTFGVETDFGIDVTTVADGDGKDEVTIGQDQHVRFTDTDGKTDEEVTVDLSERATSTSDDEGDKATTTIDQDQVFDDGTTPPKPFEGGSKSKQDDDDEDSDDRDQDSKSSTKEPKDPKGPKDGRDTGAEDPEPTHAGHGEVDPSSPFGEEPADRGTGTTTGAGTGSPSAPAGTGTAPATSAPAASASGSGAATSARTVDTAPLASAAVAAPAASVLAGEGPTGLDAPAGPELDAPPAGTEQTAPEGTGPEPTAGQAPEQPQTDAPAAPNGTGPEPFGGTTPPAGSAPFESSTAGSTPDDTTDPSTTKDDPSTPDEPRDAGDNTPAAGHDSQSDPAGRNAGSPEPEQAEHAAANDDGGPDAADHGTDGADHALVS